MREEEAVTVAVVMAEKGEMGVTNSRVMNHLKMKEKTNREMKNRGTVLEIYHKKKHLRMK